MKHLLKKIPLITLAAVGMLSLSSCSSTRVENCLALPLCNNTQRVVNQQVQFPIREAAWKPEGTLIDQEQLSLLKPGVTKRQVYDLLGVPHYNYGWATQPYWDYFLTIKTPNGEVNCQLVIEWQLPATRLVAPIHQLYWKDEGMCRRFAG
jgi:outer membrane protein assembly factor BamE (lipoprotein component of BamABCDE complex)